MCPFVLACEPLFGCVWLVVCSPHAVVWLVVGLGVDRIVDALRMLTVLTPPAFGFHLVVLGVLLFVLAY